MDDVPSFEQMWAELATIGRSARTGGYRRQPFGAAEQEARAWFLKQCERRDLAVRSDGFGNVMAWWDPEGRLGSPEAAGVLTGSHLDSVIDGGAFDGPLGVVSGLAALDRIRHRGAPPGRPIGVGVFCEEEGSRFPVSCLGSRLATGQLGWEVARELRDAEGVALAELTDGEAGSSLLADVGVFVELHVEQGKDLVDRGVAVGVAASIWPHGRYRFDFTGQADHAGTTRMADRRDPMLTFAMTALAANKQARLVEQRATFGRVSVAPNSTNAIPGRVTAWLDARASDPEALDQLVARVRRLAEERAGRDATRVEVHVESSSPPVHFDEDLAAQLAEVGEDVSGSPWPVIATAAGHDAGILAGAEIPTAMLFVRNPTGISHAPEEHADVEDCLAGVAALTDSLSRLAGQPS